MYVKFHEILHNCKHSLHLDYSLMVFKIWCRSKKQFIPNISLYDNFWHRRMSALDGIDEIISLISVGIWNTWSQNNLNRCYVTNNENTYGDTNTGTQTLVHEHRYTNTGTRTQVHEHRYMNTGTRTQVHEQGYTNTCSWLPVIYDMYIYIYNWD